MLDRFRNVRAIFAGTCQIAGRAAREAEPRARALWAAVEARYAAFRADPAAQERALARGIFVAIFAFFFVSVDYLMTGGPDWNPAAAPAPRAALQDRVEAAVYVPSFTAPPARDSSMTPADFSFTAETLLGGPDTILASAPPDDSPRAVVIGFTATPIAKTKGAPAAAVTVSASATLW